MSLNNPLNPQKTEPPRPVRGTGPQAGCVKNRPTLLYPGKSIIMPIRLKHIHASTKMTIKIKIDHDLCHPSIKFSSRKISRQ